MNRRDFIFGASTAVAATLTGCGGGSADTAASAPPALPGPPPASPPNSGATFSTAGLSTLTLHTSQGGTLPYTGAVYPLEGVVPGGQTVASPEDPGLRGTVISRWPDGSASVIVIAGEVSLIPGVSQQITLRPAPTATGTALTAARVGQLVSSIEVNVDGTSAGLAAFATPERVWWSNERVICCRYRLAVGVGVLEAVIDVHAFSSNRALVEVVIENSKFNANAGFQNAPASQSYSNASLSINAARVAATSSAAAPTGIHQGFRAWYASAWIGGDPGVEVTHDIASLQSHPLLPRLDKSTNQNLQNAYQNDGYTAWSTGRHRATRMGAGGDHPSIGYLPQWDMRYLQSGDRFARRAVLASALAVLSYNVNYRDINGGVPTFDQSNGYQRSGGGGWPDVGDGADRAIWEVAHHAAAGLVAFLCRPSPCFIEIAQKIAHWNGTWSNGIGAETLRNGTFGKWYQVRGQAWATRSLAHAIFLTPDGDAWKQPAREALYRNARGFLQYRDDPKNRLDTMWSGDHNEAWDDQPALAAHQAATFMAFYFTVSLHHAANAKVLSGSQQIALSAVADWAARFPVRWINETPGGTFRHLPQRWTIGASGATASFFPSAMAQFSDWGAMAATTLGAGAPPLAGPWRAYDDTAGSYSQFSDDTVAGAYYPSYFWAALVCAVERDGAGAAAAWSKVTANVTNLSTWRGGFAAEPRWGYYPRNR